MRLEYSKSLAGVEAELIRRTRALFDLDHKPDSVLDAFANDIELGWRTRKLPGLRVPGAWDPLEVGVRAIVGQQVSVKGATTLMGRLVDLLGVTLPARTDTDTGLDVDRYFQLWDKTRKELESEFGHEVSLEIEPGRFLVAESGYLIAEIRSIKQMGENLFYLVDAGFNNLARPILYGAYHPMSISP